MFFGDKHGQLGIWDARAPQEDEEEDPEDQSGGQYWRLQVHWPATAKSSISGIKFDPVDAHSVSGPRLPQTPACLLLLGVYELLRLYHPSDLVHIGHIH